MLPDNSGHNDDTTAEASVFRAHRSTLPPMVVADGLATEAEIEEQLKLGRRVPPAPCDESAL
jgi:hypothetical protein